jgi:methanogenic corrinoid protein MtbC1
MHQEPLLPDPAPGPPPCAGEPAKPPADRWMRTPTPSDRYVPAFVQATSRQRRPFEGASGAEFLEHFLDLLSEPGPAPADGVILDLMSDGISPSEVLLELLTPAARRIGRMWEDDQASFAEVTLVTSRLQSLLRTVEVRIPKPDPQRARRILLANAPGDQHTFGALLLRLVLMARGWRVIGGRPLGDEALRAVRDERVMALGVSLGSDRTLPAVRTAVARARDRVGGRRFLVLAGGPLVIVNPSITSEIEVDVATDSATETIEILESLTEG